MIEWLEFSNEILQLLRSDYKKFIFSFFIVLVNFFIYKQKYLTEKENIINEFNKKKEGLKYIKNLDKKIEKFEKWLLKFKEYLDNKSENLGTLLFNFFSNKIEIESDLWGIKGNNFEEMNRIIERMWKTWLELSIMIINFKADSISLFDDFDNIIRVDFERIKYKGVVTSVDFELNENFQLDFIVYTEDLDIMFSSECWYEHPDSTKYYNFLYKIDKSIFEQTNSFYNKELFNFMEL